MKLSLLIFSQSEQLSKTLQTTNISLRDALLAVDIVLASFRRQRNDQAFERFYHDVATQAKEITTASELPRVRKKKKLSDEIISKHEHEYATPKDYFRQQFCEGFDTIIAEFERRFNREVFLIVVEIEQLLLSAANCRFYSVPLSIRSVYVKDLDLPRLQAQLSMLPDLLRVAKNK